MNNLIDLIRAIKAALSGNESAIDGIETTLDTGFNGTETSDGLMQKIDDINTQLEAIDNALQG